MTTKPATRTNHLAAIHIAQKALCLSSDDAQALKLAITGVASAGAMTTLQRRRYLAHLSSLQARLQAQAAEIAGYKPASPTPRPALQRAAADGADERWGKARALWAALAKTGAVKVDTDAALTSYVKRQTQCEAWRFLGSHQINDVIESLKRWCYRAKVPL